MGFLERRRRAQRDSMRLNFALGLRRLEAGAELRAFTARFGMTPADRTRIKPDLSTVQDEAVAVSGTGVKLEITLNDEPAPTSSSRRYRRT